VRSNALQCIALRCSVLQCELFNAPIHALEECSGTGNVLKSATLAMCCAGNVLQSKIPLYIHTHFQKKEGAFHNVDKQVS